MAYLRPLLPRPVLPVHMANWVKELREFSGRRVRGKGAPLPELNSAETTQGSCSSQHDFSLAEQESEQAESTGGSNKKESRPRTRGTTRGSAWNKAAGVPTDQTLEPRSTPSMSDVLSTQERGPVRFLPDCLSDLNRRSGWRTRGLGVCQSWFGSGGNSPCSVPSEVEPSRVPGSSLVSLCVSLCNL